MPPHEQIRLNRERRAAEAKRTMMAQEKVGVNWTWVKIGWKLDSCLSRGAEGPRSLATAFKGELSGVMKGIT